MSTKKRAQLAIALIATAAIALTGCTASGGSNDAGGTTTVQIVLWPGPEGDAMKVLLDAYNAGQGKEDNVEVKSVVISREDTFTKEATLMASKSSEMDIYWTASYLAQQHSPFLEPLDGVLDNDVYFDNAIEAFTIGGELKAVPLDVSLFFTLYRTDLMDALLNDQAAWSVYGDISERIVGKRLEPKDPNEWSWDDYLAAAAYFSKSQNPNSPTEFGTYIRAKNGPFDAMAWDDVLWGMGGNWLSNGEPALDSPAAKKAMDLYRTLFQQQLTPEASSVAGFAEIQAALQSGTAAFAHQFVSGYLPLNDPAQSPEVAGKIGIAYVPGGYSHTHYLGVALNKYGTQKEAATKVLTYLASPDVQQTYADAGGLPAVPAALASRSAENPFYAFMVKGIEDTGFVEPNIEGASQYQIFVSLGAALSAGWVTTESAEDALKQGQDVLVKAIG